MNKVSLLLEFEKITDELLELDITKDINDVIALVEKKLIKRDELIKNIDSSNDTTKYLEADLLRILQKNNELEVKLSEIKLSVSNSISSVVKEKSLSSKKKKAHRGYLNVGKQNDGYFIDKKK